jgi:hypothetical protein
LGVLAQAVQDDLEEVPGPGVPFGLVEAGQVADEEDDVPGIDVRADAAIGLAGVEECGQCIADRAVTARGEILGYRPFNGGEHSALDLSVVGHAVEPASQCGDRLGVLRTTTVSPGFVRTDLADSIDNTEVREQIRRSRDEFAIPPEAVARAIAFAIEQPDDVEIGDITIRPTVQG